MWTDAQSQLGRVRLSRFHTASGLPTGKTLTWPSYRIGTLGITYTYDTSTTKEGRLLSMRYPSYWDPSLGTTRQGLGLSFEYDDMGRLLRVRNTDTQTELARSPAYNVAGQLTQWERRSELASGSGTLLTESFSFTTQGQLNQHRMKVSSASAYFVDDEYVYDDAGDGTVKQRKDNAAGDAVDYTYNVLGQLIKAETTSNEWGQSFVFDGFGNLAQQVVTKGSAPSMTLNVNPANNQVTGSGNSYDAAGNLTSTLYGGNMTYDLASRLASVQGMPVLRYTARNERLIVNKFDGTREVHMRGIGGEMIGVYRIDWENGNQYYTKPVRLPERERVYAAGRLVFEGGKFVATDRLGSVAYKFGTGLAVQNGGFESYQLAPWASYGSAQISISNVSHTGGQSMRLTTTVSDYGAYQDVKGLVAGMSYQFQVWVRAESGTNTAALAVCDPAGGGFAWTGVQTIGTNWQLLSVYFTATGKGIARIHLVKWDTTGALLWDDVEMPGGATATSGLKMRYYPYGQEVGTATANDTAKFGTYTRDASSGLDYAMNRYYQSTWGRFTSPDPYRASGGPANPGSWNRYAYVQGDPVNYWDPSGLKKRQIYWWGRYCTGPADDRSCEAIDGTYYDDDGEPEAPTSNGEVNTGNSSNGGGWYEALQKAQGYLVTARDLALKALEIPECRSLFLPESGQLRDPITGGTLDPSTVLRSLVNGSLTGTQRGYGSIGFANLGAAVTGATKGFGWRLSVAGPYYQSVGIRFDITSWNYGYSSFNVTALLHELGHALNKLSAGLLPKNSILNDAWSDDASAKNTSLVEEKCTRPVVYP